jgi:hypothetical protein
MSFVVGGPRRETRRLNHVQRATSQTSSGSSLGHTSKASMQRSTLERSYEQLRGQVFPAASILACASEHAFARRRVKWLRCRHFTQSKLNLPLRTRGSSGRCDTETPVSPLIASLRFLQNRRAVISRRRNVGEDRRPARRLTTSCPGTRRYSLPC